MPRLNARSSSRTRFEMLQTAARGDVVSEEEEEEKERRNPYHVHMRPDSICIGFSTEFRRCE